MAQQNLTNALVGFVFLAVLILIAVNYCSVSFSCGEGFAEGMNGYSRFGNYPIDAHGNPPPTRRQMQTDFTSRCAVYYTLCAGIIKIKQQMAAVQTHTQQALGHHEAETEGIEHGAMHSLRNQLNDLIARADQMYADIQSFGTQYGTCKKCH